MVTDRLGPTSVLADLPHDVEVIDVGKTPGLHAVTQDEINRILVDHAQRGRVVVRLKGGDPFLFGRGGEEELALAAHGIPVEVVPGVTSALSAPAAAGIPVTHRGTVAAVHVAHGHGALDDTGRRCGGAGRGDPGGADGRSACWPTTSPGCWRPGRPRTWRWRSSRTPRLPTQRVTRATLVDHRRGVRRAAGACARGRRRGRGGRRGLPGGAVVTTRLGQVMAGCVVLVTADRRSGELASALTRRGATVRHAPALSIVPHEHDDELLAHTKALLADPPDIVVITTGIGFRGWVEAADAAGLADELVDVLVPGPDHRARPQGARRDPGRRAAGRLGGRVRDRARRSSTCCWPRASPGSGSRCSTTAPGPTGSTPSSPPPARTSAASSSTAGARRPTRWPSSCRSSPPPTARSTPPSSPRRRAPRPGSAEVDAQGSGAEIVARIRQRRHGRGRRRAGHRKAVAGQGHRADRPRPRPARRPGPHPRQPLRAGPDLRGPDHRAGRLQVRRTVALLDDHVLPVSPSGLEVLRRAGRRRRRGRHPRAGARRSCPATRPTRTPPRWRSPGSARPWGTRDWSRRWSSAATA